MSKTQARDIDIEATHIPRLWGDHPAEVHQSDVYLMRQKRRRLAFGLLGLFLASCATVWGSTLMLSLLYGHRSASGVLPGEFETHDALVLSWPDSVPGKSQQNKFASDQVLINMVKQVCDQLDVIWLVPNQRVREQASAQISAAGVPLSKIKFIEADIDRPWIRDFGPKVLKTFSGGFEIVDFQYAASAGNNTGNSVPSLLAHVSGLPSTQSSIQLDGGNLLSNGAGLAITTSGWDRKTHQLDKSYQTEVATVLKNQCGLDQVVFLEPLKGEPTGHVDMFAAFTAPDVVVVAAMSPAVDPTNAAILDRNATQLEKLKTPCGPMRVQRIPMPGPDRLGWISFTNVVFANGVLVVPQYEGLDSQLQETVLSTYRQLLPGWRVVGLEATPLIPNGGSLHCATLNLYDAGLLERAAVTE